jgi:biopolymer transport protein TolQ
MRFIMGGKVSLTLVAVSGADLDVLSLVLGSGPMAKFVLLILGGFSIVTWGIMAERSRRFRRAQQESLVFLKHFHETANLSTVAESTKSLNWSPLTQIFRAGFREISLNPLPEGQVLGGDALEAMHRVLRKSALVHSTDLERSLGFLATTASAAPFIGLFGTVWGIMNAFRGIGASGSATLAAYAPGIAEALVATAAGLAAAIPAVIGYNHYMAKLRSMDAMIDEFIADFIHRLQGRRR